MSEKTDTFLATEKPLSDASSEPPASSPETASSEDSGKRIWENLPKLLRWIGGISLIGSAIAFLLGGWMEAAPLVRYYSFFALTVGISAAGIFCGLKLKEDKSARTFLALGTTFAPALFCQLGAIVYAQYMGTASQFSEYMRIFQFSPIGIGMTALTVGIGMAALTTCSFFGFSAMARPQAKLMTGVFVLSNSLLLLPVRSDAVIAIIGIALLGSLITLDLTRFTKRAALRTWEGRAMRTLLFVPFALLMLRSLMLYRVTELNLGVTSAAIAALLFLGLPRATPSNGLKRLLRHVSLLPFGIATLSLSYPLFVHFELQTLSETTSFGALPYAGLLLYLSRHAKESAGSIRLLGVLLALSGSLLQLFNYGSLAAAFIALAASIGAIFLAYATRQKAILWLGCLSTIASLAYHIGDAALLYRSNLWLSLAATGVAVILAASYLERHWKDLLHRSQAIRARLHDWD